MRYTIRRISLLSAMRVGCAVGWLVALCPAIGLAVLAAQVLQRVNQAAQRVEPLDITILGQPIAHIDFLETLGLRTGAQTVGRLVANIPTTIALLTVLLILAGSLVLVAALALFSIGYNLLAAMGAGLVVELREEGASRQSAIGSRQEEGSERVDERYSR